MFLNSKGGKDYFTSSLDAMRHFLHRSSAVGPILVVILIVGVLLSAALGSAVLSEKFICLTYWIAGLFCLVVLAFIGVFIYFAVTNPRALQSEECQITMRQMDLAVASKGGGMIEVNADDIVQVENCEDNRQIEALTSVTDKNATMEMAE